MADEIAVLDTDFLLNQQQLAHQLSVSVGQIKSWRKRNIIPLPIVEDRKSDDAWWPRDKIRQWVDAKCPPPGPERALYVGDGRYGLIRNVIFTVFGVRHLVRANSVRDAADIFAAATGLNLVSGRDCALDGLPLPISQLPKAFTGSGVQPSYYCTKEIEQLLLRRGWRKCDRCWAFISGPCFRCHPELLQEIKKVDCLRCRLEKPIEEGLYYCGDCHLRYGVVFKPCPDCGVQQDFLGDRLDEISGHASFCLTCWLRRESQRKEDLQCLRRARLSLKGARQWLKNNRHEAFRLQRKESALATTSLSS